MKCNKQMYAENLSIKKVHLLNEQYHLEYYKMTMRRRWNDYGDFKKDLLKETGISYGQLYRWKREGLIPESWFVKRPSPTGQETYFPKERILKRIRAIQQMKDTYSLEELAKMLTPEVSNRMFTEEDLEEFSEIDIEVAALFMDVMEKDCFSFYEILVMMVISEWNQEYAFSQNTRMALIQSSAHAQRISTHMNGESYLCRYKKIITCSL